MIDSKTAESIFKKEKPGIEILKVYDYDDEHYLVSTIAKEKRKMDTFYGVDKNTGEITNYSPTGDMNHFLDVISGS